VYSAKIRPGLTNAMRQLGALFISSKIIAISGLISYTLSYTLFIRRKIIVKHQWDKRQC
jgi:hypothetical protein